MLFGLFETNHHHLQHGPGEYFTSVEIEKRILSKEKGTNVLYFKDLRESYVDCFKSHPDRLKHLSGKTTIDVEFNTLLEKMKEKGYTLYEPAHTAIFEEGAYLHLTSHEEYYETFYDKRTGGPLSEEKDINHIHFKHGEKNETLNVYECRLKNGRWINHEAEDYINTETHTYFLSHKRYFSNEEFEELIHHTYQSLKETQSLIYMSDVIATLVKEHEFEILLYDAVYPLKRGYYLDELCDYSDSDDFNGLQNNFDQAKLMANRNDFDFEQLLEQTAKLREYHERQIETRIEFEKAEENQQKEDEKNQFINDLADLFHSI